MKTRKNNAKPFLHRWDGTPLKDLSKIDLVSCLEQMNIEVSKYSFRTETLTYQKRAKATVKYILDLINEK